MLKRRSFFGKLAGFAGAVGFISLPSFALKQEQQKPERVSGRFDHMVFFWLNEGVDADAFIRTTKDFLEKVEVVNSFHLGKPAGTPREVVDNSYSICLVVTFDSKEDHDSYQDDPVHVQYVEANKEKWNRVQIYDSWGAMI